MTCHPDAVCLCSNSSFFFCWTLLGSQDSAFVLNIYLAVKANGQMIWCSLLFCLGGAWCCLFWTGSIINQLFHQVMFDKCLHTLTKCWPQEPDVMKKRKKMHSQSSQTKARRNRKKGKPYRSINVRCLFNVFRYKSLLISKFLSCVLDPLPIIRNFRGLMIQC